ncbi:MAG: hypothetical protein K8T25_24615 [Planctomycetia bacterium]|nr:hypothetical protein [Planctomycetia bacterium]
MEVNRERLPWYTRLFYLIVMPFGLLFIVMPFSLLALLSIPYFSVFPDHHAHPHDYKGTPEQRQRLRNWRAGFRSLGLTGSIRRAMKLARRNRKPK